MKKIILINGINTARESSVAKALLSYNQFVVRILVRNKQSTKALEFQAAGAEIVEGSIEEAIKDCYGAYGVTTNTGNVKHFVLSSEYSKQFTGPATFIQPSLYYENFLTAFPITKDEHGLYLELPHPDAKLPMVSIKNYGAIAASIFHHPKQYIGRTVHTVGSYQTYREYTAMISKALGMKICIRYSAIEDKATADPYMVLDLIESHGLYPSTQSFQQWINKNITKLRGVSRILFDYTDCTD